MPEKYFTSFGANYTYGGSQTIPDLCVIMDM
jgi:hypothetical protein